MIINSQDVWIPVKVTEAGAEQSVKFSKSTLEQVAILMAPNRKARRDLKYKRLRTTKE